MTDEFYMNRCLELAVKGLGNTSPNPLVGCVIINDNQIIGEGYHQEHGNPHAEVNAINSVVNKSLLKTSTIYVSLEPCSHFGLTPPCANLILESEIPEVVICNIDPYEKVAGKGIKLLKDHGVKVTSGILEHEGNWVNRRFFEFHKNKKPFVILKWAQNQHGFMDHIRDAGEEGINWITAPELKTLTHSWRSEEDAILIGATTVLIDSPSLDVRLATGKNPLRIIVDPNHRIPDGHSFWKLKTKTLVFSFTDRVINEHTECVLLEKETSISKQILDYLYSKRILSVIVEGGASTLEYFIKENLWNEARVLTGNNNWIKGLSAPILNGTITSQFTFGQDSIKIIQNK